MEKHLIYTTFGENLTTVYRTQVIELLNYWAKETDWKVTLVQVADNENFEGLEDIVSRISIHRRSKVLSKKDINQYINELSLKLNIKKEDSLYFSSRGSSAYNLIRYFIESNKIHPKINNLDIRGISEEFLYSFKRSFIYILFDLYNRRTAKKANSITTVSNNLKEYLILKYGIKSDIIHVVPTLSKMRYEKKQNDKQNIAFVGEVAWISKKKFISHVKDLTNFTSELEWNISFFGTTNIYNELKNYNIKVFQRLAPADLLDELSKYHTGLVLRDESIVNKVSAPSKVSDYLCMGFPIIFSGEIGSLKDFINKFPVVNKYIFNIEDKNMVKDRKKEYLNISEKDRIYLADLAKSYFSVNAVVKNYISFFEKKY